MAVADPLPLRPVIGLPLPTVLANDSPRREPELETVWSGTLERSGAALPLSSAQGHSTLHRDIVAHLVRP